MQKSLNDSYVVFENSHECDTLIQLSTSLPTLEKAREYVKSWKNLNLSIYKFIE